jgi:hypothetical protein
MVECLTDEQKLALEMENEMKSENKGKTSTVNVAGLADGETGTTAPRKRGPPIRKAASTVLVTDDGSK